MSEPETTDAVELPKFEIRKGNPTDAEIGAAALVLVLALRPPAGPQESYDQPLAGGWKSYWRTVRTPMLRHGRGAWKSIYRM